MGADQYSVAAVEESLRSLDLAPLPVPKRCAGSISTPLANTIFAHWFIIVAGADGLCSHGHFDKILINQIANLPVNLHRYSFVSQHLGEPCLTQFSLA